MSRGHRWLPITVAALAVAASPWAAPATAAPPAAPAAAIDGGVAAAVPLHIEELVREISPKNIEATVRKLASFEPRHTLSDTTSDGRGSGAARRWIKAELERYG